MRSIAKPGFRRRQTAPVWNVLNRFLSVGIFAMLLVLLFFLFQPEVARLQEMKEHHANLVEESKKRELANLRLMRQRHLLQTDPEYIENIARDKLDLMKPGETIFRLDRRGQPVEAVQSQ